MSVMKIRKWLAPQENVIASVMDMIADLNDLSWSANIALPS